MNGAVKNIFVDYASEFRQRYTFAAGVPTNQPLSDKFQSFGLLQKELIARQFKSWADLAILRGSKNTLLREIVVGASRLWLLLYKFGGHFRKPRRCVHSQCER